MDRGQSQKQQFEVNTYLNDGFISYKHAAFHFKSELIELSIVDYLWIICIFSISGLDSHSDSTLSLQSIHW